MNNVLLGEPLLEFDNLHVDFLSKDGRVQAVRGATLSVRRGESLALVGESGSGKSVTARAGLGYVARPGSVVQGQVRWKGREVISAAGTTPSLEHIRGSQVALIPQDAMTALNPLLRVGGQVAEGIRKHLGASKATARARVIELFDLVGISAPERRLSQYPWELSGGMQQRVVIAMALACEPDVLIADEPTTALDVTVQSMVFDLLAKLQDELSLGMLLITHDLGVVAGNAHRIAVMYAGRVVEEGPAVEVYDEPAHPYTAGLLRSMPRIDGPRSKMESIAGNPPDMRQPPSGCAFYPRCPLAIDRCVTHTPIFSSQLRSGRKVACWRAFDPSLPEVDFSEGPSAGRVSWC